MFSVCDLVSKRKRNELSQASHSSMPDLSARKRDPFLVDRGTESVALAELLLHERNTRNEEEVFPSNFQIYQNFYWLYNFVCFFNMQKIPYSHIYHSLCD